MAGQQSHIVREHAEDEPIDGVRNRVRVVAPLAQRLCERCKGCRYTLREGLPGLARSQPLGIGERPLEPVARCNISEVLQSEFVGSADAVGPVGADSEPPHVRDDQQRRVLQRQRVGPKLSESSVEIGSLSLVLPGKVVALPDIGPAVPAGVLASTPLEAVCLAGRVGLGRGRLAQQPAQVDRVLLRLGALLQLGGVPLRNELVRRHQVVGSLFGQLRVAPGATGFGAGLPSWSNHS